MINSWKIILEKRRQDWKDILRDKENGMTTTQLTKKYHRTRQGIYWILHKFPKV